MIDISKATKDELDVLATLFQTGVQNFDIKVKKQREYIRICMDMFEAVDNQAAKILKEEEEANKKAPETTEAKEP